ncbi:family 20 glycosylhydrolase [Streptomyces sp. NPDC059352]|uniref:family 20 glycosylhydrolase n=1 Tax=Streptomyces sp. NPDC059352 TaxID=3346810 RepID=UPI0036778911
MVLLRNGRLRDGLRALLAAFVVLAVWAGLAGGLPSAHAAAKGVTAVNAKPQTVPALQQWTGGTGSYVFTGSARIVRNTADATALATTSQVFADDLKAQSGLTLAQVTGTTADLLAGDIFLTLGSTDTGLGTEGYALSVTDRITVSATTDAGAFYGTRTILQLLHQSSSIPQGTARDWALKPERGLMVDDGRKFFTADWLRRHVKELAYLKLNYLHLHLSDNLGFRIESTKHPEYVSAAHLTQQEVRDLITLAAQYHVTVVPEFDAPGHMDTILAQHTNLKLVSNTGVVNHGFIDLSKDASYTLIKDIYDEYLALFPGPYFHIGSDEYVSNYAAYPQLLTYARAHYGANATAKDAYYGFINWANGIVRAAGKTTRMWNDGIKSGDGTVQPASNIVVEFWYNDGISPQALVDRGHLVSNESWDPTYYVLGGAKPNSTWGYETWTPDLFQGSQTLNTASKSKNLGTKVHVWSDNPGAETEDQIASGIADILRVVAQQTWGSPKLVTTFTAFKTILNALGHNPAWPSNAQPGNLAAGRPVTVSSTETPNFPGVNAVDSDYNTRWSSAYTNNEWITVDLGAVKTVNRVKLAWEVAYGQGYKIQTSVDGTAWTDIFTTTTGNGGTDDLTGLTGSGRYVRMQGTQRATVYGFSLYEFEVYGPASGPSGATYTVGLAGTAKSLNVPSSSSTAGTQLDVSATQGGNNQRFTLTAEPDGSYSVKNVNSGLCMDVTGNSTTVGAAIIQWTCTGNANQHWYVTAVAGGYTITSVSSGLLLTSAGTTDGSKITQQSGPASATQTWTLTQV